MPRPKSTGLPPAEEARMQTGKLLEVASQVFLEQGYQAASTNEIARRAKASKQTFYIRFQTKEQLFLAVIDYRTSKLPEQFSLLFSKSAPVRQVLLEVARALLSAVLSKEHITLLRIVYMEAPHFPAAAKLLVERGPDRGTDILANYLQTQSKEGSLQMAEPLLAAQQFSGLVVGDLVHRALLGLDNPKLKSLVETRVETSVDAFLKIYAGSERKLPK